MSDEHDHSHDHDEPAQPGPGLNEDAGSRALAEALKSSFLIVRVVMVVLVLVFLGSGFFMGSEQQRKVILRFGRPLGEGTNALLGPGLHWSFPAPIDQVVTIPYVGSQAVKSTVGWYLTTPELEAANMEPPPGESLNPAVDGYTITGDGSIIHARATLFYHVEDPVQYAFNFVTASNVVRDVLDNALLFASAQFKVDDVLGGGKVRFREVVQRRVDELIQRQKLGIVTEQCQVEVIPPRRLRGDFEQVTAQQATMNTARNTAVEYGNQMVNEALAQAANITNAAETERTILLASIHADTNRFLALLPQYQANPGLIKNILLYETLSQVMTNVQGKWLVQQVGNDHGEIRVQYSLPPLSAPRPVAAPSSADSKISQ